MFSAGLRYTVTSERLLQFHQNSFHFTEISQMCRNLHIFPEMLLAGCFSFTKSSCLIPFVQYLPITLKNTNVGFTYQFPMVCTQWQGSMLITWGKQKVQKCVCVCLKKLLNVRGRRERKKIKLKNPQNLFKRGETLDHLSFMKCKAVGLSWLVTFLRQ